MIFSLERFWESRRAVSTDFQNMLDLLIYRLEAGEFFIYCLLNRLS